MPLPPDATMSPAYRWVDEGAQIVGGRGVRPGHIRAVAETFNPCPAPVPA